MRNSILCVLVVFIVLSLSCSIEKRHYLPGYHVQWNNKSKARNFAKEKLANESAKDVVGTSSLQEYPIDENVLAEVSNSSPIVQVKQKTKRVFNVDCDSIFLKDGSLVLAKNISVENSVIVYKLCGGNNSDLVYEKHKSKIKSIKYNDGKFVNFSANGNSKIEISDDKNVYTRTVNKGERNRNEANEKIKISEDKNVYTRTVNKGEKKQSEQVKVEIFGLLSFLLIIFGLILITSIAFSNLFSTLNNLEEFGLLLGLVSVIVSPIFSIVSLIRFKNYPDDYKGMGFTIVALFLMLLILVLIII